MRGLTGSLGHVAEFINGAAFKPEDWGDEGARIIRIQNLTDPAKPYNRTTRDVSERIQVQPGDLLVSWSATLGVFEWNGPDVGYLNQHIFRVVPNETKVDKRYLRHALELALLDMRKHLHGATMLHVNRGEFLSTELYLPPLSEQRRIAAILDKADALRTKRREALAQLDRLAQSIFVEMFGDPDEHLHSGEAMSLSEVVAPGKAVTYGIVQAGPEVPDGVPYIKTGDIKNGRILEERLSRTSQAIASAYARSAVSAGDIVMSIRATVGTTAIVPPSLDGANLTQGTARIAPGGSVLPAYLLSYLRTDAVQRWIQAQVKGATFREITLGRLRELPVFVPRLSQQEQFAARLNAVAGLESSKASSLVAMEGLFASLQQRAFRGKL